MGSDDAAGRGGAFFAVRTTGIAGASSRRDSCASVFGLLELRFLASLLPSESHPSKVTVTCGAVSASNLASTNERHPSVAAPPLPLLASPLTTHAHGPEGLELVLSGAGDDVRTGAVSGTEEWVGFARVSAARFSAAAARALARVSSAAAACSASFASTTLRAAASGVRGRVGSIGDGAQNEKR